MHHWFRALFRKTGKFGRRSTWLSKKLLNELKCKAHKKWKQGQTTKEKYKSTAQTCWGKTRKTKAQLDLKLERNIKANKMRFYEHVRSEKKLRENGRPFLNGRKPSDGRYGKGCSMTFCLRENLLPDVYTHQCYMGSQQFIKIHRAGWDSSRGFERYG